MLKRVAKLIWILNIIWLVFASYNLAFALPKLHTEVNQSIDVAYSEVFFVYFRYGNPTSATVTPNISTILQIKGDGFIIDPEQLFDLYYPVIDSQPIPQIPVCDNSYSGFDYKINPKLLKDGIYLKYGPQTSTALLQAGGSEIGQLQPRGVGCLRIGLRVKPNAQIGQSASLNFNPDVNHSMLDQSPGEQSINLKIGETKICGDNHEWIFGECELKCQEDQIRDKNGKCSFAQNVCSGGNELFDGKCMPICKNGENRDTTGICLYINHEMSFFGQIWSIPMVLSLLISLWSVRKYTYKKIRRWFR